VAIVFSSPAFVADPAAAGTHALIVGVGEYPFLDGGKNEVPNNPFGLKQLKSSPISARGVRDWMTATGAYAGNARAGLNNPAAPLATVECLISDAAPPAGEAVDDPKAGTFRKVFYEWLARCDANPGNVAFLYLCGHGLRMKDLVFLASDFGEPIPNRWIRAFSLDSIRLGMRKSKARSQFMFFDCCRTYPSSFSDPAAQGEQLFDSFLDHADDRGYAALYSTQDGSYAFAKPDEPSYFTRALIDGLLGYGAERRAGAWLVTNKMINKALQDIMSFDLRVAPNLQVIPGESPGHATLHVLKHVPTVRIQMKCDPLARMNEVEFSGSRAAVNFVHPGSAGPLRRDVEPGEWKLVMAHRDNLFAPIVDDALVAPPIYDRTFQI
jgi:hypothetical protein